MSTQFTVIYPETIKKSMMNDDDMILQFVELYLIQCPIDLEKLNKSIKSQNLEAISSAAHHIKPTMEYIGAKNLKKDFQKLELLGSSEGSFEDILKKYQEIESKFNLMLEELKTFKHNLYKNVK